MASDVTDRVAEVEKTKNDDGDYDKHDYPQDSYYTDYAFHSESPPPNLILSPIRHSHSLKLLNFFSNN